MPEPEARAPIRFRESAYVFFEDPGSASWRARWAAAELPMAALWAASLLGFLVAILAVPNVPRPLGALIGLIESALFIGALYLSGAWLKGHRTPVVTEHDLVLEGAFESLTVAYSEILRVEIRPLRATDPPRSRVTLLRKDEGHLHLDLPQQEALSLCRILQRRLFGGGSGVYDAAMESLDRARDPVSAWVARLRERFGKSGYRYAAGIAEDELDRALHDAALPAARRVGAALALSACRGPEGRERLMRIAERLETAALRIAVQRAADGTLDEETIALAEAEDDSVGRSEAMRADHS